MYLVHNKRHDTYQIAIRNLAKSEIIIFLVTKISKLLLVPNWHDSLHWCLTLTYSFTEQILFIFLDHLVWLPCQKADPRANAAEAWPSPLTCVSQSSTLISVFDNAALYFWKIDILSSRKPHLNCTPKTRKKCKTETDMSYFLRLQTPPMVRRGKANSHL